MPSLERKLLDLQKKSKAKGNWQVEVAVAALLLNQDNLDARINLIGAMHEVGLLSNSMSPYWADWRPNSKEAEAWASRCVERLQTCDADYWAVAGLLELPLDSVKNALASCKYKLLAIRFADSIKEGRWHIASFCGKHQDRVIAPIIEIGWSSEHTVNEASRWRAVILEEQAMASGSLIGRGFGSYFMRAKLPYGCWRIHEETFELKKEWIVPKQKTPLADYK